MSGELWKICGLAVLCAVSAMILSRMGGEFAGLLRLAGSVLVFGVLILGLGETLESLRSIFSESGAERYADLLFRALGLSLLTAICANLCRDTGETAIASGVEMAGKLSIVALCLPLVGELMKMASELLSIGTQGV